MESVRKCQTSLVKLWINYLIGQRNDACNTLFRKDLRIVALAKDFLFLVGLSRYFRNETHLLLQILVIFEAVKGFLRRVSHTNSDTFYYFSIICGLDLLVFLSQKSSKEYIFES